MMFRRPVESRGSHLVRAHDLLEHLIEDVHTAFSILEGDKQCQYLRRCVARAVFAFVEGMIQIVKYEIVRDLTRDRIHSELSTKDQELLYEQRIKDDKQAPIQIPIDRNMKLTFRLATRVWNLQRFKLETKGAEYRDFLRAKDARNRLTHPREYSDIEVTDADMHCYAITFVWSRRCFVTLWRSKLERVAGEFPEEIREQIRTLFGLTHVRS